MLKDFDTEVNEIYNYVYSKQAQLDYSELIEKLNRYPLILGDLRKPASSRLANKNFVRQGMRSANNRVI